MPDVIDMDTNRRPRDDRPPRREPRKPASPPPPRGSGDTRARAGNDRKLKEGLQGLYTTIGMTVLATAGDDPTRYAGEHIVNMAEPAADAWIDLGNQNPKVKAALVKFSEGTAAAAIIGIHVTMLAPFLLAKGMIPERIGMVLAPQMFVATDSNGNGDSAGK